MAGVTAWSAFRSVRCDVMYVCRLFFRLRACVAADAVVGFVPGKVPCDIGFFDCSMEAAFDGTVVDVVLLLVLDRNVGADGEINRLMSASLTSISESHTDAGVLGTALSGGVWTIPPSECADGMNAMDFVFFAGVGASPSSGSSCFGRRCGRTVVVVVVVVVVVAAFVVFGRRLPAFDGVIVARIVRRRSFSLVGLMFS